MEVNMLLLCRETEKYIIRVLFVKALSILEKYTRLGPGYFLSVQEVETLQRTDEILSQIQRADVFLGVQTPQNSENIPTAFELFLWGCWYNILRSNGQIEIPVLQDCLKNMNGEVARDHGSLLITILRQMRDELE